MDANDTQWLVKPNDIEILVFRWSGIRVDFIRSPEWLRSMVYDWEFEPNENSAFRCALKLFYTGPRVRAILVQPGEFILRIGELLIVLSDEAFRAIFMEDDREESV
jgi:hypothetical protein